MACVANAPGSKSSSSSSSSDAEEFHEYGIPRTPGKIPPVPKTGHISSKMRKSIIKGEMIDLALMRQKSLKDKRAKKFSFNADSRQFEEEEESQDIGFYHWLECFLTYLSICVDYFPNKPGPPRFARSTILVNSSPNLVKLALKKFRLAIKIM